MKIKMKYLQNRMNYKKMMILMISENDKNQNSLPVIKILYINLKVLLETFMKK